jgi:hypothetical protein
MILPLAFKTNETVNPALYLCKLASIHGYKDVQAMLKAYKLRLPQGQQEHLIGYTNIIKELTDQKINYKASAEFEYDNSRYFKSLVSRKVKVCPACLEKEESPLKHSLVTTATCWEHSLKLLDSCTQCSHELTFDRQLLAGTCSHCGYSLPKLNHDIPAYQQMIFDAPSNKTLDIIYDLTLAAGFILRPYDCIPTQIRLEAVNEWETLFTKAFSLLTDKDSILKWGTEIFNVKQHQVKSIGTHAALAGMIYLENHTKLDWPVINTVRQYLSTHMISINETVSRDKRLSEMTECTFVSTNKKHLKMLTTKDVKDYYNYRITLDGLAMILGVELDVVKTLHKHKTFKIMSSANSYSQNLVDMREVALKISDVTKNIEGSKHVTPKLMSLLIEKLLLVNMDKNQLWHIAFTHSHIVHIAHGPEDINSRLYINLPALMKFCLRTFSTDFDRKLIKSSVMEIYGLSELDLRDLAKHNLLHPMPWNQRHTYFRVKHLRDMENKIFCLGRYCKLRGLDIKENLIKLESAGILPVLGKTIFGCRYQVTRFLKFKERVEPIYRYKAPEQYTYLKRLDPRKAFLLN